MGVKESVNWKLIPQKVEKVNIRKEVIAEASSFYSKTMRSISQSSSMLKLRQQNRSHESIF